MDVLCGIYHVLKYVDELVMLLLFCISNACTRVCECHVVFGQVFFVCVRYSIESRDSSVGRASD